MFQGEPHNIPGGPAPTNPVNPVPDQGALYQGTASDQYQQPQYGGGQLPVATQPPNYSNQPTYATQPNYGNGAQVPPPVAQPATPAGMQRSSHICAQRSLKKFGIVAMLIGLSTAVAAGALYELKKYEYCNALGRRYDRDSVCICTENCKELSEGYAYYVLFLGISMFLYPAACLLGTWQRTGSMRISYIIGLVEGPLAGFAAYTCFDFANQLDKDNQAQTRGVVCGILFLLSFAAVICVASFMRRRAQLERLGYTFPTLSSDPVPPGMQQPLVGE